VPLVCAGVEPSQHVAAPGAATMAAAHAAESENAAGSGKAKGWKPAQHSLDDSGSVAPFAQSD
jgi:hypothetical protein